MKRLFFINLALLMMIFPVNIFADSGGTAVAVRHESVSYGLYRLVFSAGADNGIRMFTVVFSFDNTVVAPADTPFQTLIRCEWDESFTVPVNRWFTYGNRTAFERISMVSDMASPGTNSPGLGDVFAFYFTVYGYLSADSFRIEDGRQAGNLHSLMGVTYGVIINDGVDTFTWGEAVPTARLIGNVSMNFPYVGGAIVPPSGEDEEVIDEYIPDAYIPDGYMPDEYVPEVYVPEVYVPAPPIIVLPPVISPPMDDLPGTLPDNIEVETEDGTQIAQVVWDFSDYDPGILARQTFTVRGVATLPSGERRYVEVLVTVGENLPEYEEVSFALRLTIGSYLFYNRGNLVQNDVAPFIDSAYHRTMVPLRIIAEGLDSVVSWDDAARTVSINRSGTQISLVIDLPLPYGMGTPVIINDRTFVPARYVVEVLGAMVRWCEAEQAVYIYKEVAE